MTMFYRYDRAGHLVSQTYPSGKVVETAYDEVGRVAGVKRQGGSWYAGAAAGATGAIGYEPHGGIRQFRLGNRPVGAAALQRPGSSRPRSGWGRSRPPATPWVQPQPGRSPRLACCCSTTPTGPRPTTATS